MHTQALLHKHVEPELGTSWSPFNVCLCVHLSVSLPVSDCPPVIIWTAGVSFSLIHELHNCGWQRTITYWTHEHTPVLSQLNTADRHRGLQSPRLPNSHLLCYPFCCAILCSHTRLENEQEKNKKKNHQAGFWHRFTKLQLLWNIKELKHSKRIYSLSESDHVHDNRLSSKC